MAGTGARLATLLALGAVVPAACGTSGITRVDYLARANAICATALRGARNVTPPGSSAAGPSLDALGSYFKQVIPIVEREASQLRALPRPAADRALLDSFLSALGASVADYRRLASAATAGDRATLEQEASALGSSPASGLASRYGLSECAGSGAAAPPS